MIKDVKVIKGCVSCRNCENVCPSVFKVKPKSEVISNIFEGSESEILLAEISCPVQVIKVEKKSNFNLEFKNAKLLEKKYLTPDTLELSFQTKDFSFKPGQYVSLLMSDWKGKFSRMYSIASGDKNNFILNVKIHDKGRGSKFLKNLDIGDKLDFLGPIGKFTLENNKKRKVFIATGTGLAPIVSMLENTPSDLEKIVIFGIRYTEDIYYKEKLESFKNTKIIITVSRPSKDYNGNTGRVSDYLDIIKPSDEIYICGNPDMLNDVKDLLEKKGHDNNLIFSESFNSSQNHNSALKEIFVNGNIPGLNIFSWFIILLSLIGVPILYNYINTQVLWDISWWSVVFVMLIRPLSDIFSKYAFFSRLVSLRKAFGILSSSVVVTVLVYKFIGDPSYFLNYFSSFNWGWSSPLFSRLTEITGLILLLTSNNLTQKKLGAWWKKAQRLSYIYFISGGIVISVWEPSKAYYSIGIFAILWMLAYIKNNNIISLLVKNFPGLSISKSIEK